MVVKVLRFTAAWCGPCQALKEVLSNENIDIKNVVDIDSRPEAKQLMADYGIRSVPTIIIDYGSGDFERIVGGSLSKFHKELLREWLTRENHPAN